MIYTLEQIQNLVKPIAEKYKLKSLWLFGSYARGDATKDSDIDFLMDVTDSKIINLYNLGHIQNDLEKSVNKKIDLITERSLHDEIYLEKVPLFIKTVQNEKVKIYESN